MVVDAGRALVIAFNKWDLVDEDRRYYLEREIDRDLLRVQWAPRVNVSAQTGWHVDKLVPALGPALAGWETADPDRAAQHLARRAGRRARRRPVRGGKQPKVLFATQAGDRAADASCCSPRASSRRGYRRFIERRLREEFGFEGTPISLQQRPREKRRR